MCSFGPMPQKLQRTTHPATRILKGAADIDFTSFRHAELHCLLSPFLIPPSNPRLMYLMTSLAVSCATCAICDFAVQVEALPARFVLLVWAVRVAHNLVVLCLLVVFWLELRPLLLSGAQLMLNMKPGFLVVTDGMLCPFVLFCSSFKLCC